MLLSKSKSVALGDRSFTDYGKMKNRDFTMENDKHRHFKSASLSIIPESGYKDRFLQTSIGASSSHNLKIKSVLMTNGEQLKLFNKLYKNSDPFLHEN
uniref:Uncharacterized protein n=1 Tax=Meloidogyne enterolobii TaxID=390850 RepID=A0A6V7WB42_MELEN|nr:unnamed protein product [Meloidogyne enterolobii]